MITKTCVIVPTYNNSFFVKDVIDSVLAFNLETIVVNDGSDDKNATQNILREYSNKIKVIDYQKNRGKGYALKKGFNMAKLLGFTHAITIDSDSQHNAGYIPKFLHYIDRNPDSIVIGSRTLKHNNMPKANVFANKFSNFWFMLQTFLKLADTQTGFRAYPLHLMGDIRPISNRYEAELELLIRSAWRNIDIKPIDIEVNYPHNRITHFRKFKDFFRIFVLNTIFCILALVWGYPSMFFYKFVKKRG